MPRKRIQITTQLREKLVEEMKRTGLGGRSLLHGKRGAYPSGLTSSMIDSWRLGTIASAKAVHLDWVLKEYANWEPPPIPEKPEKIMLTDEARLFLQNEIKRTGLGAVAILRHAPKPLPEGLNHQKVQNWISGKTDRVLRHNWDFVLRLYEAIETHPQK